MKRMAAIVFLLLASFMIVACSGPKNTPESMALAFIERVYQGDADGAFELIHLPTGKKPGDAEKAQGKIKAMIATAKARADEKGGVKKISVISSEINARDPNRARVLLQLTFRQSGEKKENVRLILIEGQWKIKM